MEGTREVLGHNKTYAIINTLMLQVVQELPNTHQWLEVVEWKVRTVYNGRKHPTWEVDVMARSHEKIMVFSPLCTFYGKPINIKDEINLMIWCIRSSCVMRADLELDRYEDERTAIL